MRRIVVTKVDNNLATLQGGLTMKLHHLGAVVRDADATLTFYCEVLGAKLLWDEKQPQQGEQTDTIFGFEQTEVRVVGVELHGTTIEFFEFLQPELQPLGNASTNFSTIGWKHPAFEVTDVEAEVERLKIEGVRFVFPVQTLPGGAKMVYFLDNDGLMLEFIQPSAADAADEGK